MGLTGRTCERREGCLLARPWPGGSPRELLEDVLGRLGIGKEVNLAVVSPCPGRDRIEYPLASMSHAAFSSYTRANGGSVTFRFSPRKAKYGLMDHPERGMIVGFGSVTDLSACTRCFSPRVLILRLAWPGPRWERSWFTTRIKATPRTVGVNLSDRFGKSLDLPAGMTLEDWRRWPVLVSLRCRSLAMATTTGCKPMDFSWLDLERAKDISRDGAVRYCFEEPVRHWAHYSLAIRRIDSTPRCNWQWHGGAACLRTANGRFSILRQARTVRAHSIGAGQPPHNWR